MRVVSALLRFFALLYHGLLALFLFIFGSLISFAGGAQSHQLGMLPWTGSTGITALIVGGLLGLAIVILAGLRKLRPLFFVWALLITIYLIKGYFLGGYRFTPDEFTKVVYLTAASFVALLGALAQVFGPTKKKKAA